MPRANRMAAAPPTTPQKLAAEFLGTAFLVYVGAGSAAATGVIAAGTKVPFSMAQLGIISFAFMFVIVAAVYAIGHISGGHINPAVTLSLALTGKFPWREVPGYWGAQLVGALAGAAGIFLTRGRVATVAAGGGVTAYNPASMGFGRGMVIEAIGTFILVFVIFGVIDHRALIGALAVELSRLLERAVERVAAPLVALLAGKATCAACRLVRETAAEQAMTNPGAFRERTDLRVEQPSDRSEVDLLPYAVACIDARLVES